MPFTMAVALRVAIAQTAGLFIFINRLALIGLHNLLRAAFIWISFYNVHIFTPVYLIFALSPLGETQHSLADRARFANELSMRPDKMIENSTADSDCD